MQITDNTKKNKFGFFSGKSIKILSQKSLFRLALFIIVAGITTFGIQYYIQNNKSAEEYLVQAEEIEYKEESNGIKYIQSSNNRTNISNNINTVSGGITYKDRRAYVLDLYFKSFNSPLYGKGQAFVDSCERYGAPNDCILVAAIAKNETMLCTYKFSAEMHNCWGFGGPDSYRMRFNSFEEGIDRVTDVLVNQYGLRYMIDPRLMEDTFCGTEDPLCANWGNQIISIRSQINNYAIELGVGSLL
jgi:hypothetical protein